MTSRQPFLLLLLLLPAAASAEVYRWTDAKGQVHYTQTPPPGTNATEVAPPPPPASAPSQDALNERLTADQKAEPGRKQEADAAAQAKAQQDANCRDVRNQIATLDANGPRRTVVKNEQGGVDRMTVEQFEKHRNELQDYVRAKCS